MRLNLLNLCAMSTLILFSSWSCASEKKFVIENYGVGPITLGAVCAELPKSFDGLYDKVVEDKFHNEMYGMDDVTFKFYQGDNLVAEATPDEENKIYSIMIFSPTLSAPNGACVGMPVSEMFSIEGVKQVTINGGEIYYKSGDCLFRVDNVNADGRAKLDEAYMHGVEPKMTIDDYTADATVSAILIFANL